MADFPRRPGDALPNTFSFQIAEWVAKAKDRADLVLRHVAMSMFRDVVLMSPVDTGRFRANWYPSIDVRLGTATEAVDKSGAVSLARVESVTLGAKVGDVIWMTNNLPYSLSLEYGWSRQAPAGMIRVTIERYGFAVQAAVEEAKKAIP